MWLDHLLSKELKVTVGVLVFAKVPIGSEKKRGTLTGFPLCYCKL